MPLARAATGPCVDTLHHPTRYSQRQIVRAVHIAMQATEALGHHGGYVRGDMGGNVIGVYGDRGVLVLTEPPERACEESDVDEH